MINLPNEFEEKMKALLGDEFEDYIKCYDEPRYYGLRVNTEKISVEDFLKVFELSDFFKGAKPLETGIVNDFF